MGILRLLLALAVLCSHAETYRHLPTLPGVFAVEGFFLVSGFYMALILERKYRGPRGRRLFYEQRFFRLWPLYGAAVLLTLAVSAAFSWRAHRPAGAFQAWGHYGSQLSPGSLALIALPQLSMVGLDSLFFLQLQGQPMMLHFTPDWPHAPLAAARFTLVPAAWSLSLEIVFYACAPFLVRCRTRTLLAIVTLGLSARGWAFASGLPGEPWNGRFLPFEFPLFLLGALSFRLLPQAERLIAAHPRLPPLLLSAATFAVLAHGCLPGPAEVRHWLTLTLILAAIPLLFAASRGRAWDRTIGELSYPLYLLHEVTLQLTEPITRRLPGLAHDGALLLFPLLAAWLAYRWLNQPIEAWRARRFAHHTALLAA